MYLYPNDIEVLFGYKGNYSNERYQKYIYNNHFIEFQNSNSDLFCLF